MDPAATHGPEHVHTHSDGTPILCDHGGHLHHCYVCMRAAGIPEASIERRRKALDSHLHGGDGHPPKPPPPEVPHVVEPPGLAVARHINALLAKVPTQQ